MGRYVPYITVSGLLITAIGCGGGGGLSVGGDQTINMGQVSATYKGPGPMQPAVVSNNNGVVITGIDQANYTQIILNPAKSLENSTIAFTERDAVWTMTPSGGDAHQATSFGGASDTFDCTPSWFPGALGFAYVQSDALSGYPQVFNSNLDGTGTTRLTNLSPGCFAPAWSPGGSKVAFVHMLGVLNQVYTVNGNGTGTTLISDGTGDENYPTYSPDGTRIYVSYKNSVASNYSIAYYPSGGGALVPVLNIPGATQPFHISFFPDGQTFVIDYGGIIREGTLNGGTTLISLASPLSGSYSHPSVSPDGQKIAMEYNNGSGSTTIMEMNSDGTNLANYTANGATTVRSPAWSPFLARRVLVGSTGPLGTAASGFLFATDGPDIVSFAKFSAVTPSTAKITQQSGTGTVTNVVFQLTADSINDIRYMNGYVSTPVIVIPANGVTAVKGALISFSASNGKVVLVIPFNSSKRLVSKTGALEYSGTFTGVYNASGKNLASSGATHVAIDPASGKLLNFN